MAREIVDSESQHAVDACSASNSTISSRSKASDRLLKRKMMGMSTCSKGGKQQNNARGSEMSREGSTNGKVTNENESPPRTRANSMPKSPTKSPVTHNKGDANMHTSPKVRVPQTKARKNPINLLFIMCDQLRFDTLGFIQRRMSSYDDKLHVQTPNIDRLAASGVSFDTTYCASPICGPARIVLKTGNSLQRTGYLDNAMFKDEVYEKHTIYKERIEALVSFEQVLAEQRGYQVATFGKWHVPDFFYFGTENRTRRAIWTNYYDYQAEMFELDKTASVFTVSRLDASIFIRCLLFY
jgi:Sulfatase